MSETKVESLESLAKDQFLDSEDVSELEVDVDSDADVDVDVDVDIDADADVDVDSDIDIDADTEFVDDVDDTYEETALDLANESEIEDAHPQDNVVDRRLRKLNKNYKSKADRKAERAALSEMEGEDYVPEEHEPVYDVTVDKKIYSNNYAMAGVLILFGVILFPYSKTATALLVFYGLGVAWMAFKGIKTKVHVENTTFTIEGVKYPGTYTFDQVDKIIYVYNKKEQRRYWIYVDNKRIGEIPPGAIHSRWLYDDMIGYGVPGGWYNKL